jgi:hypothetical protein
VKECKESKEEKRKSEESDRGILEELSEREEGE